MKMKLPLSLLIALIAGADLLFAQPRPGDSPVRADSLLQAASVLYYEGAYARVIDLLQPSTGTLRSPKANYYLGSSFAALNDPQNAIRYLRMAVDNLAADIPSRFQLAKSLNACGAVSDARTQYRLILAQDSTFLPALFNLGTLCFDGRDFGSASDLFSRAVGINPRDYLSYYNLAASLVNLGKPDSAMQFFRAGTALNPRYVPCLSLLASLYYKRKEYQDAERLYGMILARDRHTLN
jgi:tetratricopeptide (TPR) repeat protein